MSGPAGKPGATEQANSFLGISAGASGKASVSARIEFGDEGPPQLVLSQSVNASVSDSASIPGLEGSIGGSGTVTVQERFELPEDFSVGDAVRNPLNAAKEIASNAKRTGEPLRLGLAERGGEDLRATLRVDDGDLPHDVILTNVDASVNVSTLIDGRKGDRP